MDVVVDGFDNMKARYAANKVCVKLHIRYIFGAALETYGNTTTIIPYETPCLECFYGKINDDVFLLRKTLEFIHQSWE